MGRARIIEPVEAGLYRARPLYDMTAIETELAKIEEQEAIYHALLLRTLETIADLRSDKSAAGGAVDAVLEQWQQHVIAATTPPPPLEPPEPNDPLTGQPWEDPDRAQEPPLLVLLNALRTAASVDTLSRDSQLDTSIRKLLKDQAYLGTMGHISPNGMTPAQRVHLAGYLAELVGETLAYGRRTPAMVAGYWERNELEVVIDPDYTDVGLAHVHAPDHPAGYLWGAVFAKPGEPPPKVRIIEKKKPDDEDPTPDPAKEAAEEETAKLEKIQLPELPDKLTPASLAKIVAEFGKVSARLTAAEKRLEQMMAERLDRIARRDELQKLKERLEALVYDVWACYYINTLKPGDVVYTAEVPGHWVEKGLHRDATIYKGTEQEKTIFFDERSWNIVPRVALYDSQLKSATVIKDNLMFYNLAMEPGHLRWKPAYRYGTITDIKGNVCTVQLTEALARNERSSEPLTLNNVRVAGPNDLVATSSTKLEGVIINYPPCHGEVFEEGDDVLIQFADFDWSKPTVIGFRRAPKACPPKRSWEQLV